jgi:hypothetical protein
LDENPLNSLVAAALKGLRLGRARSSAREKLLSVLTSPLVEQRVVFTGLGPFLAVELWELLPSGAVWELGDATEEDEFDVVVIGRKAFSEDLILGVIDHAASSTTHAVPRFLPQEGFVDELLFGNDWWNYRVDLLNETLEHHEGLQFARSFFDTVDFPWPSTEAVESPGSPGGGASSVELRNETPLRQLGYQITGTSRGERWRILTEAAVPQLGLREVAYTIAENCCRCKRQRGGRERYEYAIGEWEHDLARLKREYYGAGYGARFHWPTSEP